MRPYFPLNFSVEGMQPNILLMCKLMFVMLILYGFVGYIEDPHVPYIPQLDVFLNFPNVFKVTFKSIFLVSGILLLFNIKPKTMAIVLGSSIIIILLASKPLFRNHLFICGCVFLLAGCTHKNSYPWLLFVQLSLVYLGAFINKIFQIDWWNGQFMHNWLVNARENQIFIYTAGLLPDMWLAKVMSWSAMLTEITISILLFFRNKHQLTVWMILLFHSVLYTMTAFRFGHFYEDIIIILLIFINWKSEAIQVRFNRGLSPIIKKSISFLNFSKTFEFANDKTLNKAWLEVKSEGEIFTNWKALRLFLFYSTNFYVFLFFLDLLIRFMFNGYMMDVLHIVFTWIFILFFIPFLFKIRVKKKFKLNVN